MNHIPTTQEIYVLILSELEAEFNITIPQTGQNYLRTMAAVQAAELRLLYLFAAQVQKNIFADTADPEDLGGTLERFGRVKLGRDPFNAIAGIYECVIFGTIGAVIPANTQFKSDDDSLSPGLTYVLDSAYTIVAGPNTILLRALTPGLDGDLQIGNTLTSTAPLVLIDRNATVTGIDTEPIAAETIAEYRENILRAFRLNPQGGAQADYVLWANEVQGVSEAYPYTTGGNTNTVDLFIEATVVDSIDGKGTPDSALIQAVSDAIELPIGNNPSRKPITTIVSYLPITPLNVDIEINNYVDLTPDKQTLIENALTSYYAKVRPFLSGVDSVVDRNDITTLNNISSVILDAVPGSIFDTPVLKVSGNVEVSHQFINGDIPYFNSIAFI